MDMVEEEKKDNLYLLTTQWLVAQIVRVRPWEVHGSREFCIIAPRCNNSPDRRRRWNKSHQRGCVYGIIIINYETPAKLQLELTNANIIATMQCPVQIRIPNRSIDGCWMMARGRRRRIVKSFATRGKRDAIVMMVYALQIVFLIHNGDYFSCCSFPPFSTHYPLHSVVVLVLLW